MRSCMGEGGLLLLTRLLGLVADRKKQGIPNHTQLCSGSGKQDDSNEYVKVGDMSS